MKIAVFTESYLHFSLLVVCAGWSRKNITGDNWFFCCQ